MNKKGFTLTELLAVIVVLAIIVVIAMPVIINVINDTKVSSLKTNVRLAAKEAENHYSRMLSLDEPISKRIVGSECSSFMKINAKDFDLSDEGCIIEYDDDGNATVSLKTSKNSRYGYASCVGNINDVECIGLD